MDEHWKIMHQSVRRQIWAEVYAQSIGNNGSHDLAESHAEEALDRFDKRFPDQATQYADVPYA